MIDEETPDPDKGEITTARPVDEERLHADVSTLILSARERVALYVNQEFTLLY